MSAGLIHFLDKELLDKNEYTSNDTVAVPTGVTQAIIEGYGGGGSGQPANGGSANGGDGGFGSAMVRKVVTVVAGETLTITVGAGGAGVGPGLGLGFGSDGADSIVSGGTSGEVFRALGAAGGGKTVNNANANGRAITGVLVAGGSGQPAAGYVGQSSHEGFAGGNATAAAGGGAGGPGGTGGDGSPDGANGSAAAANSGGGGGGSPISASFSSGAGGDGKVTVYFINPK